MLKGIVASEGLGIGKAFIIKKFLCKNLKPRSISDGEIDKELTRLDSAIKKATSELAQLKQRADREISKEASEIFQAQIMILNDPLFMGEIIEIVKSEKVDVENSYLRVMNKFIGLFEKMKEEYFRERADDIREVGERVIGILHGRDSKSLQKSDDEIVLVGSQIGISDLMNFDKSKIAGICVETSGGTSHMAIFAKTLEIPMIVGLTDITSKITDDLLMIMDGIEGKVILSFDEPTLNRYKRQQEDYYINKFKEKEDSARSDARTLDGHVFMIDANIEREEEAMLAAEYGANSIGLYRTEYLFAEYERLPSEEEQVKSYSRVLKAFPDKPVIIRSFDLGGDKQFYRFKNIKEENPFLGLRGIRISLQHITLFITQLKALYKSSPHGKLHILFPMISSIEEIHKIKEIIKGVKDDLKKEKYPYSKNVKLGVLLETPASTYLIDDFSREVDFFSIGTNDLLQFILAVDRNNPYISESYNIFHPAIFRSLKKIIDRVHQNGLWTSICGEMASNPLITPVLLGFGIDKMSLSPPLIPRIKKIINKLHLDDARELADTIMKLCKSEEIKSTLENFHRNCIKAQEVSDEMPPLRS
ncbi:MAG: phosphoenolpyruvate--protein phosphotransferase [Candidatus Wallbacteria bacterium]|nr:phosphoenolpyruvate--protein phosphotransferase [Candidatus Wallbacteria bacterium]